MGGDASEVDPRIVDALRLKPKTEFGEQLGLELREDLDEQTRGFYSKKNALYDVLHHVITEEHIDDMKQIIAGEGEITKGEES
ncbi:MAG TPA: hypothetical protein VLG25_02300 [Patescibacteria group bacterium]|nr:hypothetical protein [Patescibacteria group bacterium]